MTDQPLKTEDRALLDLTRPIIGIENRTAQEAFDIMADRIKHAAREEGRRAPKPSEEVREGVAKGAWIMSCSSQADFREDKEGWWTQAKGSTSQASKDHVKRCYAFADDILAIIPARDEAALPEAANTPKSVVMPNGDVLTREYESWDRGVTLKDPQGKYATNEEGWELVESYGLDALVRAMLYPAPPAQPVSELPGDVVRPWTIGQPMTVVHDLTPGHWSQDYRPDQIVYFAGETYDCQEREVNVWVADQWPPRNRGDVSDGWRREHLTPAEPEEGR